MYSWHLQGLTHPAAKLQASPRPRLTPTTPQPHPRCTPWAQANLRGEIAADDAPITDGGTAQTSEAKETEVDGHVAGWRHVALTDWLDARVSKLIRLGGDGSDFALVLAALVQSMGGKVRRAGGYGGFGGYGGPAVSIGRSIGGFNWTHRTAGRRAGWAPWL